MRSLFLSLSLLAMCMSAAAQPAFNSAAFAQAFKKVLQSSFTDFKAIKGDKIGVKDSFKSKVLLPGAAYTYIDFLGLGTYNVRYAAKDSTESSRVAGLIKAAVSKGFGPAAVKIFSMAGEGYTQYRFIQMTAKGFLNNRVVVNEFHQANKGRYEVDIFVSAIPSREFISVKNKPYIKDDSLKSLVISLIKNAKESYWDDLLDSAITPDDADFKNIIDFDKEARRYRSKLLAPGAMTYIETDENGSDVEFTMLYKLGSTVESQIANEVNKILGHFFYALPKNYAVENFKKSLADGGYFSTIYPMLNYESPLYDGIEVETEQVFTHGDGEPYLAVRFKLSKSFFKEAMAPLDY